jgi:hypothetical protein
MFRTKLLEDTMSQKQHYPLPHAIFFIAVTCAMALGSSYLSPFELRSD